MLNSASAFAVSVAVVFLMSADREQNLLLIVKEGSSSEFCCCLLIASQHRRTNYTIPGFLCNHHRHIIHVK